MSVRFGGIGDGPIGGSGVAGTPAGGVLTVQGDPAGSPVPIASGQVVAGVTDAQANNLLMLETLSGATWPLMVMNFVFNGATWDKPRTPVAFKSFAGAVISAETTIWTPAAGKKFRLMGYAIAQGVAAGAITLKDNTAGATILVIPQHTIGVAQISPPMGNGILSAAANNVLTAIGIATETITGYVFGTEE